MNFAFSVLVLVRPDHQGVSRLIEIRANQFQLSFPSFDQQDLVLTIASLGSQPDRPNQPFETMSILRLYLLSLVLNLSSDQFVFELMISVIDQSLRVS